MMHLTYHPWIMENMLGTAMAIPLILTNDLKGSFSPIYRGHEIIPQWCNSSLITKKNGDKKETGISTSVLSQRISYNSSYLGHCNLPRPR
jgi:hypothetical protein